MIITASFLKLLAIHSFISFVKFVPHSEVIAANSAQQKVSQIMLQVRLMKICTKTVTNIKFQMHDESQQLSGLHLITLVIIKLGLCYFCARSNCPSCHYFRHLTVTRLRVISCTSDSHKTTCYIMYI